MASLLGYNKKKNQVSIDELSLLDIVEEKEEFLRTGYNHQKNMLIPKNYGKTITNETYKNTLEYSVLYQKHAYTETDPLHLGAVLPEETFEELSKKVIAPSLLQVYPSEYAQDSILFRLSAICSYFFVVFSFFVGELTLGFDFFYIVLLGLVYLGFVVLGSHISYNLVNLLKKIGTFGLQIIWYFSGTFFNPNISKYFLILENIKKNLFFKIFKILCLLFFSFILFFIVLKLFVLLTFYFNLLEYLETFIFRNLKHLDFCNSLITRGNPRLEKISSGAFASGDYWYLQRKFFEHKVLVVRNAFFGLARPDPLLDRLMREHSFGTNRWPNKRWYMNVFCNGVAHYLNPSFMYGWLGKSEIWYCPLYVKKNSILVNTHFPRLFGPFGNDISTFMMSERGLTYRYVDGPAAGRFDPVVLLGRILNGSFFYDTFTQFNFKFLNVELVNLKKKMDFLLRVIPNILIYFETQLDFLSVFEFIFSSLKTKSMFDNVSLNLFFDRLENNDSFQTMRLARFFNNNGSVLVGQYDQINFDNFATFAGIKCSLSWFDYKLLLQDPMYFFNFSLNNFGHFSVQNQVQFTGNNKVNLSPGFMSQVLKHRSFFYNFICKFSDDFSLFLLKLKEISNYTITVMTSLSKLMLYQDFFRSSGGKRYEISANEPEFNYGLTAYLNAMKGRLNTYKIWQFDNPPTQSNRMNDACRKWNFLYFEYPERWMNKPFQTEFFKPINAVYPFLKRPANYEDMFTYLADDKTEKNNLWTKKMPGSKRWRRCMNARQAFSPYYYSVPQKMQYNSKLKGIPQLRPFENNLGLFGVNHRLVDMSFYKLRIPTRSRSNFLYWRHLERHSFQEYKYPRLLQEWRLARPLRARQYPVIRVWGGTFDSAHGFESLYRTMTSCRPHVSYYFCPHEYALLHSGGLEYYHPKNLINTVQRHQLWRYYPAGLAYSEWDHGEIHNPLGRPVGQLVFLRHPIFSESLVANFFSAGIVSPKKIDLAFTNKIFQIAEKNKVLLPSVFRNSIFYWGTEHNKRFNPAEQIIKEHLFFRYYHLVPVLVNLNLGEFVKLSFSKLLESSKRCITDDTVVNLFKIYEKNAQLSHLLRLYRNKTVYYEVKPAYCFDSMFGSTVGKSIFYKFRTDDKAQMTSDWFATTPCYLRRNPKYDLIAIRRFISGIRNHFELYPLERGRVINIRGLSYIENYYKFRTMFEHNQFESLKVSGSVMPYSMFTKVYHSLWNPNRTHRQVKIKNILCYMPLFRDTEDGRYKSFLSMFRDLSNLLGYHSPYRSVPDTTLHMVEVFSTYMYRNFKILPDLPATWEYENNTMQLHLENTASFTDMDQIVFETGLYKHYRTPQLAYRDLSSRWYNYTHVPKILPPQKIPLSNILLDRADSSYLRDMYKCRNYKMPSGLTWAEPIFDLEVRRVLGGRPTKYIQGYYLRRKRYEFYFGYNSFISAEIPIHHAARLIRASISQTLATTGGGLKNLVLQSFPSNLQGDYFKSTGRFTYAQKLIDVVFSFSNRRKFTNTTTGPFRVNYVYLPYPSRKKNNIHYDDMLPKTPHFIRPLKWYYDEDILPTYFKLFKNKNPVKVFDCKLGFPLSWIKKFAYVLIENGSHKKHLKQILGIELDFKLKLFLPIKQSGILPSAVEHFLLATYCWEEVLKEIEKKDFTYKFESLFNENGEIKTSNELEKFLKTLELIADYRTSNKMCFDMPELSEIFSRGRLTRLSGLKKEDIAYYTYKSTRDSYTGLYKYADNMRDSEEVNKYFKEQEELVEAYLNVKVASRKKA